MAFSESSLQKTALALSLLGLFLLFAFSVFLEAKEVPLFELDESFLGEKVKVQGRLTWFKTVEHLIVFQLTDELGLASIKVVVFSPSAEDWRVLSLKGRIEVEGEVKRYNGELELVAEKISALGFDAA
jgi:hypothetical protein